MMPNLEYLNFVSKTGSPLGFTLKTKADFEAVGATLTDI